MSKHTPVSITGVWLRTAKDQTVEVLVEIDGQWRLVIAEKYHPPECSISHIVNPGGIRNSPPDPLTAPAKINGQDAYEAAHAEWLSNADVDRWQSAGLLRSDDPHLRLVTAQLLTNNAIVTDVNPAAAVSNAPELIAKVMPMLLIPKLVSIQPKLSPNTKAYGLSYGFESGFESGLAVCEVDLVATTRKLKVREVGDDLELTAVQLADELNMEVITDLFNNAGTVITTPDESAESLCNALHQMSDIIHRKLLMGRMTWIVVGRQTYKNYQKLFENSRHVWDIHVVDGWREKCVLTGWKGKNVYDSPYIWAPYILFSMIPPRETFPGGIVARYNKYLFRWGAKAFGRVMISSVSQS